MTFVFTFIAITAKTTYAAGVVGNGTPESCTDAALNTALTTGGLITFNCGPSPHTIILNFTKQISQDTEIDGGGLITLGGANAIPHIQIFSGNTLTVRNLTLSRGFGVYGSIENFGTLYLIDSQITLNNSTANGGGVNNFGTAVIDNSSIDHNSADMDGGGIYNESGTLRIENSQIYSNTAGHGGGGIAHTSFVSATIDNTLIHDNYANQFGGGIYNDGIMKIDNTLIEHNQMGGSGGGGIFNSRSLIVSDSTIESNFSKNNFAFGAGIYNNLGTVALERVSISSNSLPGLSSAGGAIENERGNLSANEVVISYNQMGGGGAVHSNGILTLTNSIIYSNTSNSSGGVGALVNQHNNVDDIDGTAILINVTVSSNNTDMNGTGGIFSSGGVVTILHSTIVENEGVGLRPFRNSNTIVLKNTIVANNDKEDCSNSVSSDGFNISSDSSCGLDQVSDLENTNPMLGLLADNGGQTQTYLPQTGSLAIDGGQCIISVDTDQRGVVRPFGAACDIGSVEVGDSDIILKDSFIYLPLVVK